MRKSMKRTMALLAVMAVCGTGSTLAAEAPVYTLKGITVTATRQAESLQDVPANVQVITEKDIKSRNVQTASDAVSMATGVSASNSIEGTVNLRGYSSKNILVLVDGQQMNTAWNGDVDWNMIPVDNIRKIEVVSGGQSALYGGRAVGGVINIMTKTQKQDGVHGNALVSYGSHGTVKQAYSVSGKKDKVTWGTFYESKQTNGWRNANIYVTQDKIDTMSAKDQQKFEGLDKTADGARIVGDKGIKSVLSENYGFNLGYNFSDDKKITYKYTHAIYDWKYSDGRSYTGTWTGPKYTTSSGKKADSYKITNFMGDKGWRTYNMHSLTYNDQKNKVHAHFGLVDYTKDGSISPTSADPAKDFEGTGKKTSYPSKSWDFDINKRWNVGAHKILVGTSYGQDQFSEEIFSEVANWKNWNSAVLNKAVEKHGGKDKNWSLYVQDKWTVDSKWTAYIGGRYDYYQKHDGYAQLATGDKEQPLQSYNKESYSKFSPKLSLDYKWNDDTNLYVSYGKSFNPPILYQVYRYSESSRGTDTTYLPNPSLNPETTDNWELGLKKKIGNKTDIHADAFYAKTTDAIKLQEVETGKKKYLNAGDVKTHGFELALTQHHSDAWTSYINYTWQTGKIDGEKDYDIPRHLLHLGTTYNKDAWTVNVDGSFISDRTEKGMESGHFKARDAYFLLNLNTNYQFNKNFSMQFSVENLLDRSYYDEDISSNHYYIGDGRTYTISARYTF